MQDIAATRRSRRWALSVGGGASLGLAALAACAPGAPGTTGGGSDGAAPSTAPATLRIARRPTSEEQAYAARLPLFMQKFPNIKVEQEVITGDYTQALRAISASNTLPDNVHVFTGGQEYHNFVLGGAFRNIDGLLARDKVDLKGWFPEMIEIMKIDGKLFGLPFKGQVLAAGFYYNVSLFETRGVALPTETWTLDDLLRAAQQLTVRQGSDTTQWGYAINSWAGEAFSGHLRQFNGDSLSKDGKKAAMDTPETLEALQWYEAMFHRERVLHPVAEASNDFLAGKVAMIGRTYFNYKSTILPGVGDKFKWDGQMMPKHAKTGKRGGIFAGDTQALSRDGKTPDQAFELLKFVTDKEFGVALGLQTMGSTTLGGRPDCYADERILNAPQYTRQMQKAQLDSMTQIKEPSVTPHNFRAPDVWRVRDEGVAPIAAGQQKAEPAHLKELSRQMQALLDLPRP